MSAYQPKHSRSKSSAGAEGSPVSQLASEKNTSRSPQKETTLNTELPASREDESSDQKRSAFIREGELSASSEYLQPSDTTAKKTLPALGTSLISALQSVHRDVGEAPEDTRPTEGFALLGAPAQEPSSLSQLTQEPSHLKKRIRRWPIIIGIVLAAIIICGVSVYFVLSSQALEREQTRAAAYELLDESIALIQESDQVVIMLDTATTSEVTAENLSEREVLLQRVPATLETLSLAEERATDALDMLASEEDKALARHVVDAVYNRQDMLTSGEDIITRDIEAMNAALLFGESWELIVNADSELRATTELSRTAGYNELYQAIERNNAILVTLTRASELLAQAEAAFEEADFSVITEYLSHKTQSVQLAIEADQAVLNGDIATVNAKNAEFSEKDAAVVDAATRIPADPFTLILTAYEASTAESRTLYDSARANAAEADGYIREYVGVEAQTGVQ